MAVRAKCMLPRSVAYVNGRMIRYDQVPLNPEIFTRKNWLLLTTLIWGITFGDTFNQLLDRVKLPDGLQMLNLGTRVRARRSLSGSESDSKSIHIEDSCWINNHHLIFIGRVRILQSFPLCSKTTFGSDPTHCSWCRYIGIFTLNDMFINKGYWDITWYWDITLYWDITWYWDITYNMIFTLILGYNMHVIYTSIYYTYKFLPSSRVQVDPQHFALDLQRTAKGTIQTPIV
jgi:hypothetical protein